LTADEIISHIGYNVVEKIMKPCQEDHFMKDFDSIYNKFEAACDQLDDGVQNESELKALSEVLEALGEPKTGQSGQEAGLYAYACAHMANGYYSLAEYEEEIADEDKEQAVAQNSLEKYFEAEDNADKTQAYAHYKKALEYFIRSYELFENMNVSEDRDYLFADCCQMFAEFIWDVRLDPDMKGFKEEDLEPYEAYRLYRDSVDFYERLLANSEYDTREELIDVCFNAGGYHYEMGSIDLAKLFFSRAKSLAVELEDEEPGAYKEILEELEEYLQD
jgi:uncharacterized UPF0160 family protein